MRSSQSPAIESDASSITYEPGSARSGFATRFSGPMFWLGREAPTLIFVTSCAAAGSISMIVIVFSPGMAGSTVTMASMSPRATVPSKGS